MESLEGMFPGLPRAELQAALDAHAGDAAAAVESLLSVQAIANDAASIRQQPLQNRQQPSSVVYESGDAAMDAMRMRMLNDDERLARELQAEEDASQQLHTRRASAVNSDVDSWGLPMMAQMWDSLCTYGGSAYEAGKSTVDSIVGVIGSYLGDDGGAEARPRLTHTERANDGSAAVYSPAATAASGGSIPRRRHAASSQTSALSSGSSAAKKAD